MPNSGSEMQKPVVRLLFCGNVDPGILDSIGWGLEEEGIPAISERVYEDTTAVWLAKRAACQSRLHVGIGISARSSEAVLHHRDLPDEHPLLSAPTEPGAQNQCILLGKNAARLVKGNPLVFAQDAEIADNDKTGHGADLSSDMTEWTISRIAEALLSEFHKRKTK